MPRHDRTAFLLALNGGALIALVNLISPRPLFAQASFSADSVVLFQAGGTDQDQASGPSPVSVSSSVSNTNGTAQSESTAERGLLELSGSVSASNSRGTSGTFGNMAIEFRDVVIHRTDGQPSDEEIAVTLQYFTSFDATWTGPVPSSASLSRADMDVIAQIVQSGTQALTSDHYLKTYSGLSGGTPGLETLDVFVLPDIPLTVKLSFGSSGLSATTGNFGQYDMSVHVGPDSDSFGEGASSFRAFGSAGGSVGNSVFILPPGYTADSVEMRLVDNQWQAVVPEPTNLALLWPALVAIRRRRIR